jgi:hypothetical protein
MTHIESKLGANPWYREPWPWILMAGPFIVVVAALITAWIAVKTNDGLVTEDYYKKGLTANLTIAQSDRAVALGIEAALQLTSEQITVRLFANDHSLIMPGRISVTFSHPTRAGLDQQATLEKQGDAYISKFRLPLSGHWLVLIEDEAHNWRLLGNVSLPAAGEIRLGGVVAAGPPVAEIPKKTIVSEKRFLP